MLSNELIGDGDSSGYPCRAPTGPGQIASLLTWGPIEDPMDGYLGPNCIVGAAIEKKLRLNAAIFACLRFVPIDAGDSGFVDADDSLNEVDVR